MLPRPKGVHALFSREGVLIQVLTFGSEESVGRGSREIRSRTPWDLTLRGSDPPGAWGWIRGWSCAREEDGWVWVGVLGSDRVLGSGIHDSKKGKVRCKPHPGHAAPNHTPNHPHPLAFQQTSIGTMVSTHYLDPERLEIRRTQNTIHHSSRDPGVGVQKRKS